MANPARGVICTGPDGEHTGPCLARLERIVGHLLDLIVEIDAEGRLCYVSPNCLSLLGYSPDHLIGHTYHSLIHPEDIAFAEIRQDAKPLPNPGPRELRIRRADGHYLHMEVHGRRIRTADGSFSGAVIVARDTTGRRVMESALLTSEQRYRDLVDHSEDLIFSYALDGCMTAANRSLCRVLGRPEGSIVGHDRRDVGLPLGLAKEIEHLHRRIRRGAKTAEGEFTTGSGEHQRVFRTTLYPIMDQAGAVNGVGAIARDITSQVKAMEDIRYLTFHDKLTGLHNRAYFEEELSRHDTERSLPLAIIIGDINGLKMANDALGHAEGDRLLANTAQAIRRALRSEDLVCRWGGDEFAIILPQTRASVAGRISQRIADAFRGAAADPIPLSIALGLAVKTDPDQSIESVLREAENRMYRNKLLEGRGVQSAIVAFLQRSLWEKTHETEEHAQRLELLAQALGRETGLAEDQLTDMSVLALLHDVGKVGLPDSVLNNTGRLSEKEWELVKRHPEVGYRIAAATPDLAPIAESILSHHEQWDGTGYPQGLSGENIPLSARILAIADAYDVMVHGRPYRPAIPLEEALAEIERAAGTQFDPNLVAAFLRLAGSGKLEALASRAG